MWTLQILNLETDSWALGLRSSKVTQFFHRLFWVQQNNNFDRITFTIHFRFDSIAPKRFCYFKNFPLLLLPDSPTLSQNSFLLNVS